MSIRPYKVPEVAITQQDKWCQWAEQEIARLKGILTELAGAEANPATYQTELQHLQSLNQSYAEVLRLVVEWNEKYPTSRIYNESTIRKIAAEMDGINEKARDILQRGEEEAECGSCGKKQNHCDGC